jgi:predicted permease
VSWFARLRNVFRSNAVSDEIDRELAFHLAERIDDLVASGMQPEAARREARRRFGGYALQKENTRDRDLLVWLETLVADFRYGLRGLRRSPVFFVTAVLTLGVGIGANTAVFTLLHGLLLRSLPVPDPQELARIDLVRSSDSRTIPAIRYQILRELQERQRSFVELSAWRDWSVTITEADGTLRRHTAGFVSGNSFEVLGLRARLGRLIGPTDDVSGGPADGWPAVLSDSYWRDRFGSDPGVIGSTIEISGSVVTVVGVAPPAFHGVWSGYKPELYLPLRCLSVVIGRDVFDSATSSMPVAAIGRLKPGVSLGAANAELAVHQDWLLRDFRAAGSTEREPAKLIVESARSGLPTVFGRAYSAPLYLMQGLVAIVLLLCCVNVSGLMLSKLHQRRHEFAVRTAVGAARTRLVRQYLTESFVIALAGAALGAVLAWYGSTLLLQFFRDPNMGIWMSVQPDQTVFLVTAALAVSTTLFFGILPALKAGRANPATLLKSRTAAERQLAGRSFVAIQVALSLVLVVLAALLSQSLVQLRGERTGFEVDRVTIQTPPFHVLPQKGEAKLDLYQRMVDRIAQSPDIRSAAVTWYTPMTGLQSTASFHALADGPAPAEEVTLAFNSVGPGYFRTMATAILAGREFEPRERQRDVCVLNQAAANVLFPRQAAIGRYVRTLTDLTTPRGATLKVSPAPTTCRVVGVAEDAKFASLRDPPPKTVYFPVSADLADGNLVFLMNAATKAAAMAAYRDALQVLAPTIPLVLFATLREQMDASLGSQRAITLLSTFFGGVALFLSAIGLYGMLSSSVTQRTGEIGIRVALGASRAIILRMIFADALRLAAIGVLVGTLGLFFAVRSIAPMLYGVSSFDPMTLAVTGVLLTLVVLIASFRPARRAASVDPMRAMRAD